MANQLKTVEGVVEATAQNAPERYGLRIGPEWYDGFGECPVEKGAEVEVWYTDNGKYHDLQEVAVVGPGRAEDPAAGESASVEESAEVVRITRAVALKCAATVNSGTKVQAEDVVYDAEIFENWLRRAGPRRPALFFALLRKCAEGEGRRGGGVGGWKRQMPSQKAPPQSLRD